MFTAQLDSPVAPGGWLRVIDVQLAAISEELGGVLDATRHGVAGADLIDQVLEMGVGHDDAREILRDLVNDRLLIVGAPDSTASSSS
ncbi:MAG: hypothetical protein R3E12_04980 [Candidatus Eisenbacteria bacterium]